MTDRYDRADRATLERWCVARGKPNWPEFDVATMRELLRADDLDREDVERSYQENVDG